MYWVVKRDDRQTGTLMRRFAEITMSGPVTITDNEARTTGGAIWSSGRAVTIPAEADVSDNTASFVSSVLPASSFLFVGCTVQYVWAKLSPLFSGGRRIALGFARARCYL